VNTGDARVARPGSYTPAEPDAVEAEQAGLVHSRPGTRRLDFRHPLVRAAVVELSTSSERRAAHQALAELAAGQPDRQAWHFAEAATGPDERVAELLERIARRILRRGDAVGAVSAMTRAAELSPGEADRGRRLAEAAYLGAEVTGDISRAARLLDDAWRAEQHPQSSLQAATAAAYLLLNGDGDVETAHRLLAGALDNAVERPDLVRDARRRPRHDRSPDRGGDVRRRRLRAGRPARGARQPPHPQAPQPQDLFRHRCGGIP
jgi:hypothetical protein